jgi:hypothetical protein
VYKRLAQDGTAALEQLFDHVRELLAARLHPFVDTSLAPFASGIYAIDQSTLDPVARTLPPLRPLLDGDPRLLPGKLDAVFDVRRQLWHQLTYTADAHQNEKAEARTLITDLPAGSLLVADLGYFGFRWFDDLTDAGYHWFSRLRTKTSYVVIHPFYEDEETLDALIWLGAYRADRAKHAVRLVQFRQGRTLYRYITNVRDARVFPPSMLVQVYACRWEPAPRCGDQGSGGCRAPFVKVL